MGPDVDHRVHVGHGVIELHPGQGGCPTCPGGPAQDFPLPRQNELPHVLLTAEDPTEIRLEISPDLHIGHGRPLAVIHMECPKDQPIPPGKDLSAQDVHPVGR